MAIISPRVGERDIFHPATFWSEAIFTLKASRPGFYLTAIWFFLLPHQNQIPAQNPAFWLALFYITLPLGMLIYGGNDLSDAATDRLNPRKDSFLFGARPTNDQIFELPWRIALFQIPFVALFTAIWGAKALVWFGALAVGNAIYNRPKGGTKDFPFVDLLSQCGYLLVFVLSDWTRGQISPAFVYVFGFAFAMHSHLFGQIMDIAPDKAGGRFTTAIFLGATRSKLLIAAILSAEVFLASFLEFKPYLAFGFACGSLFFLADALIWREREYPLPFLKLFFVGFNALLLLEILFAPQFAVLFDWMMGHI